MRFEFAAALFAAGCSSIANCRVACRHTIFGALVEDEIFRVNKADVFSQVLLELPDSDTNPVCSRTLTDRRVPSSENCWCCRIYIENQCNVSLINT